MLKFGVVVACISKGATLHSLMGGAAVAAIAFTVALAQTQAFVQSQAALSANDLAPMHKTYDANEARFMRDYRGRRFAARLPIHKVTEHVIERGTYVVGFGNGGSFFSDVSCWVKDQNLLRMVTDLNKGDLVEVSGSVTDHFMGSVTLDSCSISK